MNRQNESELAAFFRFAELARLCIVPGSVEKRHPPEPDISCVLDGGEQVAYELVEVCNPRNIRFAASAKSVHRSIEEAVQQLRNDQRRDFIARYTACPLSFYFRPEASLGQIQRVLPLLLEQLLTVPDVDGEFTHFTAPVAAVVDRVRHGGRLIDEHGLNFNLGGYFDPSIPLDAIADKLGKTYQTSLPIELVAHFGGWAWAPSGTYRQPLIELLSTGGLGPFRRVWVVEWESIGVVYPAQ